MLALTPPPPPPDRIYARYAESFEHARDRAQSWREVAHIPRGATCSPFTREPTPSLSQSSRESTPSLSVSDPYARFASLPPLPSWLPAVMHCLRDFQIPRATREHVNVTLALCNEQIVLISPAHARRGGYRGGCCRFVVSALQNTPPAHTSCCFRPVVSVDVPIRAAARLFNDLKHALSASMTWSDNTHVYAAALARLETAQRVREIICDVIGAMIEEPLLCNALRRRGLCLVDARCWRWCENDVYDMSV